MKIHVFIVLLFLFPWNSKPYELVDSKVENYRSGRRGGGSGFNIELILIAHKPSKKLHFKSLSVSDNQLKLNISDYAGNQVTTFSKKDTVKLTASYFSNSTELNVEMLELNYSVRGKEFKEAIVPNTKSEKYTR